MLTDEDVVYLPDIIYGSASGIDLMLDITMPRTTGQTPLPVVVFLHGGGWERGDKASLLGKGSGKFFAKNGFIAVSVNYRLTHVAVFPAQIHDVKAAIRWVKTHEDKYNMDPAKIGIWGHSAGGHLAALAGVAKDVVTLEGDCDMPGITGEVQAVITSAAPVDLLHMGGWHNGVDSSDARLLGGPILENQEAAKSASPITYMAEDSPPFLIIHGDRDDIVPYEQAETLFKALPSATLVRVKNGDHDYNEGNIYRGEIYRLNLAFLNKHLVEPKVPQEIMEKRRKWMEEQVVFFSRRSASTARNFRLARTLRRMYMKNRIHCSITLNGTARRWMPCIPL
jgi:acetyl esterase/lipase